MKNNGIRYTKSVRYTGKENLLCCLASMLAETAMFSFMFINQVEIKGAAMMPVLETEQGRYDAVMTATENIHIQALTVKTLKRESADILCTLDPAELDLFARCVESEAGDQGLYGKQLVADVILNRVKSPDFPDTISDVILHRGKNGTWQFSVAGNGAMESAEPTEETYEAIRTELAHIQCPSLIYFSAAGFPDHGTPWKKVGGHYFNTGE